MASSSSNDGARMLRRGYHFFDGADPHSGGLEAGVLFLAFQRGPRREYVPMKRRPAEEDAPSAYLVHTACAVFAIPPAGRLLPV